MKKGKKGKSGWNKKFGAAAKRAHAVCKRQGARGKNYQRCVGAQMKAALR